MCKLISLLLGCQNECTALEFYFVEMLNKGKYYLCFFRYQKYAGIVSVLVTGYHFLKLILCGSKEDFTAFVVRPDNGKRTVIGNKSAVNLQHGIAAFHYHFS